MIATIAALHLLALGQTKLAEGTTPEPAAQAGAASPAGAAQPAQVQPAAAAPLQQKAPTSPAVRTEPPPQVSLFSADTLHGTSYSTAWLGWPQFGAMYGQGITDTDDIGALFSFDYSSTELRLGGWYRRPLGATGSWLVGGRLGINWYADFGTHWYHKGNHSDRGVELVPALLFSTRAASGIITLEGDLPLTVTLRYSGGIAFQPTAAATYEAALYRDVTVGVRFALWYRAGAGDAPMKTGHGGFDALVVAGYRFF